MKFRLQNVIALVGLALCVPTAVYALAPVEDDSAQTQTVQTGSLVPADTSQSNADGSASDSAPVTDNSATTQQAAGDTDNTPLIGSASMPDTTPTLQSPSISSGDNSALSSLPLSARVSRVEQQMQNMVHANTAAQVNSLQQQIQQLSGELQVQQHDIKLLNTQLRNFYQDLSTQIKQLKNMNSTSDDSSSSTPPSDLNTTLPSTDSASPVVSPKKKVTTSFNSSASSFGVQASDKYKSALNALMHKKYVVAAKGFREYVNDYPSGHFVMNAHYWLGEIAVLQRNLQTATNEFNIVVKQFPHSNKVADAKVKLAIIHASEGKVSLARGEFMKVKQQYPGTTAAQLSAIQLQQLNHG
jgi:tol-pal system protein YbgF